jgi:heme-degrading monooxygenase HmoA
VAGRQGVGPDGWHLAQVNIALPREPLDAPLLADFVAALAPVNAVADASPGFVWRLQTEDGDATAIRAFGDDRLIVNMSVWQSLEALRAFVYGDAHAAVLRRRREWFVRLGQPETALWWVPAGTTPGLEDAEERLAHLRAHGATPRAFTLREPAPAPGVHLGRRGDAQELEHPEKGPQGLDAPPEVCGVRADHQGLEPDDRCREPGPHERVVQADAHPRVDPGSSQRRVDPADHGLEERPLGHRRRRRHHVDLGEGHDPPGPARPTRRASAAAGSGCCMSTIRPTTAP